MNFIALELEDPFGDDANDLPMVETRGTYNVSAFRYYAVLAWPWPLTFRMLGALQILTPAPSAERRYAGPWLPLILRWKMV